MKKLQLIVNKKYATATRIGIGNNSEVYLGFQLSTEKQIAIKVQIIDQQISTLQRQAKFYKILKGGVGIPNLYWYGIQNKYKALVIDILGPSLQQLLKYCKGTFSLKTVLLIADQAIDRIQFVHSKGLLINDVQPNNFLVGLGEKQDKIFLTDFGSCQKYKDINDRHVAYGDENEKYYENIIFKSINSHVNKKKGRRDDLQSLGYNLVYYLKGTLPWITINKDEEDYQLKVKQKKVSVPIDLLCQNLPNEFIVYFNYVRSLEFEQQPDYSWIKRLFKDLFDMKGYHNNRVLDWAERHKY